MSKRKKTRKITRKSTRKVNNTPKVNSAPNRSQPLKLEDNSLINDRFRILKKLNEGAYGQVYKVYDRKFDLYKAIKVFDTGKYPELKENLRNEAKKLANINHENIVRIFDFHESNNFAFIDMEFIDGKDLREITNERQLSHKETTKIAKSLAKALKAAHEKRIYHNDIKPENIMLSNKNRVIITDFGIADNFDKSEKERTETGTIDYMAPEKRSEQISDAKTDIFSYGLTLYELLYHKYPFDKNKSNEIVYKPSYYDPSYPLLNKVIKKSIKIDRQQRYEDFSEIIEDLNPLTSKLKIIKKVIPRFITKYVPKKEINNDQVKRDLKILAFLTLCLFILLPFFLLSVFSQRAPLKSIDVETDPLSIFINGQKAGISPKDITARKDDLIQLKNNQKNIFRFYPSTNLRQKIELRKNKILVNGKIKGQIINSTKDLPIKDSINFLYTNIDLQNTNFRFLKKPPIDLAFGRDISTRSLDLIPENIRSLSINGNKNIKSLKNVNKTSLEFLELTDSGVSINSFEKYKKLKHLEIKNMRLPKNLDFSQLPNLKTVSLSNTNLLNLKGISKLNEINSVSLTNMNKIEDISFLNDFKKLRNLTLSNLPNVDKKQINKLLNEIEKKPDRRTITYYKTKKFLYVFILLIIVSLIEIMYILIKISMNQQFHRDNLTEKEFKEKVNRAKDSPTISKEKKEYLLKLIKENKIVGNSGKNVLAFLEKLKQKNPDDPNLKKIEKKALKKIKRKINRHQKFNEYEPIFLYTNKALKYMDKNFLQRKYDSAKQKLIQNNIDLDFIDVKGGSFNMGDFDHNKLKNALPVHKVILDDFQISKTMVTNSQYANFLNSVKRDKQVIIKWINLNSPYCKIIKQNDYYKVKDGYQAFPVFEISWEGAMKYCKWVNGRLPTEAEWEFCARNRGKKVRYPTGNDISKKDANYLVDKEDSRWHSVVPVMSYKPNEIGLYEMAGNLLEWCLDFYESNYENIKKLNPSGPKTGKLKVIRGGAWCFSKTHMRTYYRGSTKPSSKNNFIGFRVVKK